MYDDEEVDETVRLVLMDLGVQSPLGPIFAAIKEVHVGIGLVEMGRAVSKYRDMDYGTRATHDVNTGARV